MELGFYLLVPLIFARPIQERRGLMWALLITLAAVSYACALAMVPHRANMTAIGLTAAPDSSVLPYLWIFLLGSAARLAWHKIKPLFEGSALLWLTAYLGFSIVARHWSGLFTIPDFKMIGVTQTIQILLLAGCTLSAAHTMPKLSRWLRGHDLSYGLYLYHMPVIMCFMAYGAVGSAWLWPLAFAGSIAAAAASWIWVERPALALKARRRAVVVIT